MPRSSGCVRALRVLVSLILLPLSRPMMMQPQPQPQPQPLNDDMMAMPDTMQCPYDDDIAVCTMNGTDLILFPNECLFRRAEGSSEMIAEQGLDLQRVDLRLCLQYCQFKCFDDDVGICAADIETSTERYFANRCEMVRYGCAHSLEWYTRNIGPCPIDMTPVEALADNALLEPLHAVKRRDALLCKDIFDPVCCEYNGEKQTFSSECVVHFENSESGKEWIIIAPGYCEEDSPGMELRNHEVVWNPLDSGDKSSYHSKDIADVLNYILVPMLFQTNAEEETYSPATTFTKAKYVHKEHEPPAHHQHGHKSSSSGGHHQYHKSHYAPAYEEHDSHSGGGRHDQQHAEEKTEHHHVGHAKGGLMDNIDEYMEKMSICRYGSFPVCATLKGKRKTFKNICKLFFRCLLFRQAWKYEHNGACHACPKKCPPEYKPICASRRGTKYTIANKCFLDMNICRDPQNTWNVHATGECPKVHSRRSPAAIGPDHPDHREEANGLQNATASDVKFLVKRSGSRKVANNATARMATALDRAFDPIIILVMKKAHVLPELLKSLSATLPMPPATKSVGAIAAPIAEASNAAAAHIVGRRADGNATTDRTQLNSLLMRFPKAKGFSPPPANGLNCTEHC